MKTTTLPTPTMTRSSSVKSILTKGIIYLTSEKFTIFAGVIAAVVCWWGVCTESNNAIAAGAAVWIMSFAPWALRRTARDIRQDRLGLKQW